jgi:hypothetical protein
MYCWQIPHFLAGKTYSMAASQNDCMLNITQSVVGTFLVLTLHTSKIDPAKQGLENGSPLE